MHKPKIVIASDHAGIALKKQIEAQLIRMGWDVTDLGTHTNDSVDYPDYANALSAALLSGQAGRGILICGSGIGMSIAANRHKGIRAALCHNAETARLARLHNDANVLCLGARLLEAKDAEAIVELFLTTDFEGGRHLRRVEKMG
jgi:ribose 5-phosphate isomerase B